MSGIQRGVTNAFGLPAISAATTDSRRPRYGIPWQLFFNVNDKIIYYDDGTNWSVFSQPGGGLSFDNGLTKTGLNVTNDLTTGKSTPQTLAGLQSSTGSGLGLNIFANGYLGSTGDTYIQFFAENDNYACFFQKTGAWNFGGQIDPSLTTPYYYQFLQRGNFLAQIDFNAAIKLNATTGSHIQSLWQTTAPTGNANQTHLFFDSVGSPSFRIGTNNWFKFTPNTLTANRNYSLQDSNYTLAGIDIAQTFSALQTFSAGATFGAAINATAGSAATTSINFGTAGTGIYGTSNSILLAISGTLRTTLSSTGILTNNSHISTGGDFQLSSSGAQVAWVNKTKLQGGTTNGNLLLINNSENDFGLLQFGGTGSNFPAIRRNGTTLEIKLADNSAFAPIAIGNTINVVNPTSPDRTITMNIGGNTYYIPCKTTND